MRYYCLASVRGSFLTKYWRGGLVQFFSTDNSPAGATAGAGRDEDWEKNSGIIEGVWVFVRHGDRAPSRPLSPPHKVPEESEFWRRKLPRPDSMAAFQEFSRYFPPDIHPSNNGQFLDVKRAPFGFLTHAGVKQMHELGSRLFNRYNRHGYHQRPTDVDDADQSGKAKRGKHSNYRSAYDFLKAWDMKVYSTNYLRTIMSAQSFLDGLLGTQCYSSLGELIRRNFAGGDVEWDFYQKSLRVPNHGSFSEPSYEVDYDDDSEALLKVEIRGPDVDTLNAFDRAPELMAELVSAVISSAEFQERDGAAAPSAARLANILPGLARKKKNTSGFNAAPSGINWIEASDHFVCRTAHNVEFSRFSDFEHDDRVETILEAMAHQTTTHLAWRFRQWYKNPTLLATIAAPPLREICNQLKAATSLEEKESRPFTLYACHDVTILGLLYGVGADFLAGDDTGGWRFWPPYASTLVFELVRIPQDDEAAEASEHVVRILLNGVPVKTVVKDDRFWDGSSPPAGNGPFKMLYPEDFDAVITRLEKAGGFANYMCRENTTSTKTDMTNWTG